MITDPGPTLPVTNTLPVNHVDTESEINKIRDWLPWSIVNILFGWVLGGIFALIFSIICRSKKKDNDIEGARLMSTLALVINIICTTIGVVVWIIIIVLLARAATPVH